MRVIREIGPLAVASVVAGAVVLWLLSTNPALGRWLLAAILFGHGWVHVMFLLPRPAPREGVATPSWPFDLRDSWLVTRAGVGVGPVAGIGRVLIGFTLAASVLAALATVGILVPAAWWAGLVVAASLGSLGLIAIAFTPTLLVGIGIDLALIWLAVAGPWRPA